MLPPNMRLKLAGLLLGESAVASPGAPPRNEPVPLRLRTRRPQLKREPLGSPMSFWQFSCLAVALLGASFQVQNDPRACMVPRFAGETAGTYAVKCAEEFVERNGYTGRAPTVDSA